MPVYTVRDVATGRVVKLRGDSPPTEQELEEIFAQIAPSGPAVPPTVLTRPAEIGPSGPAATPSLAPSEAPGPGQQPAPVAQAQTPALASPQPAMTEEPAVRPAFRSMDAGVVPGVPKATTQQVIPFAARVTPPESKTNFMEKPISWAIENAAKFMVEHPKPIDEFTSKIAATYGRVVGPKRMEIGQREQQIGAEARTPEMMEQIERGRKIADDKGLDYTDVKWQGILPILTDKQKADLSHAQTQDLSAYLMDRKRMIGGKEIEEAGRIAIQAAEYLDPTSLKLERIQKRIQSLQQLDPGLYASAKAGDLNTAIDMLMFDAAISGDKEAVKKVQELRRTYEQTVYEKNTEKKRGVFETALNQAASMAPMMAKTAAVSAAGPLGSLFAKSVWAKQGAGSILSEVADAGLDPTSPEAIQIAALGSLVYASIENNPIRTVLGGSSVTDAMLKKLIKNSIARFIASRGVAFIKEAWVEEPLQKLATDISQDVIRQAQGQNVSAMEAAGRYIRNMWAEGKAATGGMAVLTALGIPIAASVEAAGVNRQPTAEQAARAIPEAQYKAERAAAKKASAAAAAAATTAPTVQMPTVAATTEGEEATASTTSPEAFDEKEWSFTVDGKTEPRVTLTNFAQKLIDRDIKAGREPRPIAQALEDADELGVDKVSGLPSLAHFNQVIDDIHSGKGVEHEFVQHYHLHGDELAFVYAYKDENGKQRVLFAKADVPSFGAFNDTPGIGHDWTNNLNRKYQGKIHKFVANDKRMQAAKTAQEKAVAFHATLVKLKKHIDRVQVRLPLAGEPKVNLGLNIGIGETPASAEQALTKTAEEVGPNSINVDKTMTKLYTISSIKGDDLTEQYYKAGLRSTKLEARYAELQKRRAESNLRVQGGGVGGPGDVTGNGGGGHREGGGAAAPTATGEQVGGESQERTPAKEPTTEAKKEEPASTKPRYLVGSIVAEHDIDAPARSLRFTVPGFANLSTPEQRKLISAERRRLKQFAETTPITSMEEMLINDLRRKLGRLLRRKELAEVSKQARFERETRGTAKYIETGSPTNAKTRQLERDVLEILDRVDDKDLMYMMGKRYGIKAINAARKAIEAGKKNGESATVLRKKLVDLLEFGMNPIEAADDIKTTANLSEGEIERGTDKEGRDTGRESQPAFIRRQEEQRDADRGRTDEEKLPPQSEVPSIRERAALSGEAAKARVSRMRASIARRAGTPREHVVFTTQNVPKGEGGRAAELIASAFKKWTVWFKPTEATRLRGYDYVAVYDPTQPDVLFLNTESDPRTQFYGAVMHELLHDIQKKYPHLWHPVRDAMRASLTERGRAALEEHIRREAETPERLAADPEHWRQVGEEELGAEFIGDQIQRRSFWRELYARSPEAFKRAIEIIQEILDRILPAINNLRSDAYFDNIEQLRALVVKMYAEYQQQVSGTTGPAAAAEGVGLQRTTPTPQETARKEVQGAATGNVGAFGPSPDIRYQRREQLDNVYTEAVSRKVPLVQRMLGKEKSLSKRTSSLAADVFAPISTEIEAIDESLKYSKHVGIRRLEYNYGTAVIKDCKAVIPWLEKYKKMNTADKQIMDLALKNRDVKKVDELCKKYDMQKEWDAVRIVLDDIYARAKDVEFEIGYLENYFPRVVLNPEGLIEYVQQSPVWGRIEAELKAAEEKAGRKLSESEQAAMINNLIMRPEFHMEKPGAVQERTINLIDVELDKFYDYSPSALVDYIQKMNHAIEMRRFFGAEAQSNPLAINIDEGIGEYLARVLTEKKLTPKQQDNLIGLLRARFNYMPTTGAMKVIKDLGYITAMGSGFSSFITQLADIGWAFYEGRFGALPAFYRAVRGQSEINKEDLGVDRIAEEFRTTRGLGKAVEKTFKYTLLEKFDSLGKETLINSALRRYRLRAKGNSKTLLNELRRTFGQEAESVIADLKAGTISDNVKYLLFNKLLDFQPVALSEMPKKYLDSPNGRIFYALKTFTLKQIDVFRREGIWKIEKAKTQQEKMRAYANLVYMVGLFVTANTATDVIKDWLFGRKPTITDRVIDNLLRLVGLSRYITWEIRRNGVAVALAKLVAPPMDIAEAPVRDVVSIAKLVSKGQESKIKIRNLETWKLVPFFGKHYYWWFGGGREKERKAQKRRERERISDLQRLLITPKGWHDRLIFENQYRNMSPIRRERFKAEVRAAGKNLAKERARLRMSIANQYKAFAEQRREARRAFRDKPKELEQRLKEINREEEEFRQLKAKLLPPRQITPPQ